MNGLTATNRSEAQIMNDIARCYGRLSPENLSADGERSRKEQHRLYTQLTAELKGLFNELGREVDEIEAYRWTDEHRRPRV